MKTINISDIVSSELDKTRKYKKLRLPLGAYQYITVVPIIGDQYTGKRPLFCQITTAIDEHFINNTISLQLSEQAQKDLLSILVMNLDDESPKKFLKQIKYSEFEK